MGNTTIIELNHDLYDEIERDPAKWVDGILDHMRAHIYAPYERIPGGAVVTTFHRGDTDEYKWYSAFREKVRARQDENERRWPLRRARSFGEAIPSTSSTSSDRSRMQTHTVPVSSVSPDKEEVSE